MALWELEEFQGPQFLGFVRNVPAPAPFIASRWLPDRTVFDLEVEYLLGADQKAVMANIMAWDAEAPISGRPGLGQRMTMELPPIKRKVKIAEKQLIRFLTPRAGTPDRQTAIDSVYDDTARLVQGIQARVEWMRMQALSEDTLAYNEAGVQVTIDYGIDSSNQYSVGVDAALSTWWDNTSTADPIADLTYIVDDMEARTGFRPTEFVCSKSIIGLLRNNDALQALVLGSAQRALTPAEVNSLLAIYDLPTLVPYDVKVHRENADGSISELKPLDPKKAVLIPRGPGVMIGETLWGPTAESRALIGTSTSSFAPGIYAVTYAQDDPPSEWIKAAAVSVPTMPGANLVGQVQVLNPA